jgi:hypothetical protein
MPYRAARRLHAFSFRYARVTLLRCCCPLRDSHRRPLLVPRSDLTGTATMACDGGTFAVLADCTEVSAVSACAALGDKCSDSLSDHSDDAGTEAMAGGVEEGEDGQSSSAASVAVTEELAASAAARATARAAHPKLAVAAVHAPADTELAGKSSVGDKRKLWQYLQESVCAEHDECCNAATDSESQGVAGGRHRAADVGHSHMSQREPRTGRLADGDITDDDDRDVDDSAADNTQDAAGVAGLTAQADPDGNAEPLAAAGGSGAVTDRQADSDRDVPPLVPATAPAAFRSTSALRALLAAQQGSALRNAARGGPSDGRYTSRFRGVSRWQEKWRAYICVSGKNVFLGKFETECEAARAYDVAARNLHGCKAKVNFDERGTEVAHKYSPRVDKSRLLLVAAASRAPGGVAGALLPAVSGVPHAQVASKRQRLTLHPLHGTADTALDGDADSHEQHSAITIAAQQPPAAQLASRMAYAPVMSHSQRLHGVADSRPAARADSAAGSVSIGASHTTMVPTMYQPLERSVLYHDGSRGYPSHAPGLATQHTAQQLPQHMLGMVPSLVSPGVSGGMPLYIFDPCMHAAGQRTGPAFGGAGPGGMSMPMVMPVSMPVTMALGGPMGVPGMLPMHMQMPTHMVPYMPLSMYANFTGGDSRALVTSHGAAGGGYPVYSQPLPAMYHNIMPGPGGLTMMSERAGMCPPDSQ